MRPLRPLRPPSKQNMLQAYIFICIVLVALCITFFVLWVKKKSTSSGASAPVLTNVSATFNGSNGACPIQIVTDPNQAPNPTDCGTSTNPGSLVVSYNGPPNCVPYFVYGTFDTSINSNSFINHFTQTVVPGSTTLYTITLDTNSMPVTNTAEFTISFAVFQISGGQSVPVTFSAATPIQIYFKFQSV